LTIARYEFRWLVRRRIYLVFAVVIPLLLVLAALVIVPLVQRTILTPKTEVWGIVDEAGIVQREAQIGKVSFRLYPSLEAGSRALLEERISALYQLGSSYLETGMVTSYRVGPGLGSLSTPGQLEDFLRLNLTEGKLSETDVARINRPVALVPMRLDRYGTAKPIDPSEVAGPAFAYFLAFLFILTVFMTSGFLLNGIATEKENKVIEVLLSSVTPRQLMTGKILGLTAGGLLQALAWGVTATLLLKVVSKSFPQFAIPIPWAYLGVAVFYFIGGYLFLGALMATLGAVVTSAREGQQMSGLFVVPTIIPFYLSSLVLGHPENLWVKVLTFVPFTSPITALMRLSASALPLWEGIISLVLLYVAGLAALWAAGRVFQTYLLVYGKRPSFGEVIKALVGGGR
jgi:ABC-2 type transport system permease protein